MSKQSFRSIAACLLGAALCVSAAACGTSDEASSSGSETSTASPQAYDVSKIETDEEIAALLPDSVKQDGVLTVGMDTSYAPAEFLAEDGKTPVGYDVDLSNALAKVLGLKADATWVTKKGNPTNVDTADLCGVRVAVQTGTTQEEEVTQMSEDCTKNGKDAIDILSNALQTDVTTNVATGKADVFYADSPVAGYAITQTDGQLEALGEDVGVTKQGIVVKKGDKQTAEALQKAMQKLMDSGVYEEILEQWGAQSGAIDKSEVNPTDVSQ